MAEKLLRPVLVTLLRLCFRAQIRGLEHYAAAGEHVLIIANHRSFLDPLLLAILLPEKPAFVMNLFQANKWYFGWVKKVAKLYIIDPSQPMSMKTLMGDMKKGAKVVLFPEGRITTSGGVMKIYDGTVLLASKTGATILPLHIEGAQFSLLSRLRGKVPQQLFPRLTLTVFPPITLGTAPALSSRHIYDILTRNEYEAQDRNRPLLAALLEAKSLYGSRRVIASDISRQEMSYRSLITRTMILSGKLKPYLAGQQRVAMLLPNSLAAMVTFVALQALGRVPCMLNFSSGSKNLLHACKLGTVRTILTSRAFIEKGKLEHLIIELEKDHVIIYLEDVRTSISGIDKLVGALKALAPALVWSAALNNAKPYDPAVILYTSGSEGVPKGVALSHSNILANIYQSAARFDLNSSDKLFNALPVFHSFGLTIGMIMPMLRGMCTFLYPSPLHYRVIPELVYDTDATIMVGTDTFFQGYAHYAHSYDFRSLRLAVAGAEKLKESTRRLYADRFGVSIMQGYGVTETSPVLSCNTELYHKEGTVGRFFPGITWALEPVEGIARGGKLWVRGANVMLGYIKADAPGVVQPQGEWHDTGDIVEVDEEDYITILGRAKRFAKIGGEMVSLAAVEEFVSSIIADHIHAAIAIPDDRKGEQILLFTVSQDITRQRLATVAREVGLPEIFMPRHIVVLESIPLLGSGKIDYMQLTEWAKSNPPA